MKIIFISAFVLLLASCNFQAKNEKPALQNQIDSLRQRMTHAYSPGVGEFMLAIQMHHAKLWFAGKNENWQLANFEIEEIKESLDDIQTYCADSPSIKPLPMIFPPLDSVRVSITRKNIESFKSGFYLLTMTCNNCHRAANHAFNVIKVPDAPPVTNQIFEKPAGNP